MRQLGDDPSEIRRYWGRTNGSEEVYQVETEPAKDGDSGAKKQGSVSQDSAAERRGWPEHDIKN